MNKIVETDIPKVRELLRKVFSSDSFTEIRRLGGMTNHTYKVELSDHRIYVVRLPGDGTEALINRANEKVSTQLACDLGIDANVLYFGETGEKISRYIDGAQTLCSSSFSSDDTLKQAAEVFRILHTCRADTKVPFDVFDMAAEYEKIISCNAVAPFEDYAQTKTQVMQIRQYVERTAAATPVPCHNDPLCENWVMDKSGKLHLIDWEYAGMNDGMWDLADLSIEAGLSEAQETALLRYYLGRDPLHGEIIRYHANKVYLDFLWSLWGKARAPFDGTDMELYGLERYARMKKNLSAFVDAFL